MSIIISIILSVATAIITVTISKITDSQKRSNEAKFKIYQEFIEKLSEMFINEQNNKSTDSKSKNVLKLFPIISIIGSEEVVKSLYNLRVALTESKDKSKDNKIHSSIITSFDKLFNAIREDLGHEKIIYDGLLISSIIPNEIDINFKKVSKPKSQKSILKKLFKNQKSCFYILDTKRL